MLLGLIVALKAWGYWLDKYQLLFSPRGVVAGASYTDVKAQLPALELLFFVALICAAMFFVGARRGGLLIPVISIVLLAGVSLIVGGIIPAVFQRFRVEPQELARERPYIARNIDATNKSFNLDGVKTSGFPASNDLTPAALQANRPTLDNIRLWDPEVLRPGVRNLQAIAQYYNFTDVDVDRYPIDGDTRQVMISVREVDPNGLAESARTWQNLHLAYTHGYGWSRSRSTPPPPAASPLHRLRVQPQGRPDRGQAAARLLRRAAAQLARVRGRQHGPGRVRRPDHRRDHPVQL